MSTVKRIVCLAKSRKHKEYCFAGKELSSTGNAGKWIRPVSIRQHEEVSEYESQYEDKSNPCVLDIIHVPLLTPRPKGYQQENWLLDPESYWEKTALADWSTLRRLADPVELLWINDHNTYHGLNDKIPLVLAKTLESSLCLIRVDRITLSVFKPSEAFGDQRKRVQARFRHKGIEYRLWVTDSKYEQMYVDKPNGDYEIGESFLTVSLGEPYQNTSCYKLVAAIIEKGAEVRA